MSLVNIKEGSTEGKNGVSATTDRLAAGVVLPANSA
jgi:hypothetical protein